MQCWSRMPWLGRQPCYSVWNSHSKRVWSKASSSSQRTRSRFYFLPLHRVSTLRTYWSTVVWVFLPRSWASRSLHFIFHDFCELCWLLWSFLRSLSLRRPVWAGADCFAFSDRLQFKSLRLGWCSSHDESRHWECRAGHLCNSLWLYSWEVSDPSLTSSWFLWRNHLVLQSQSTDW